MAGSVGLSRRNIQGLRGPGTSFSELSKSLPQLFELFPMLRIRYLAVFETQRR